MKIVLVIVLMISCLNAELVRNNRTNIVKDSTLNIEWQDDTISSNLSLSEAKKYCSNLSLRGSQWRVPNLDELKSIMDKTNFYPAISDAFTKTSMRESNSLYWSTTPYIGNKGAGWLVGFWGGGQHYSTLEFKANVRCVRKKR